MIVISIRDKSTCLSTERTGGAINRDALVDLLKHFGMNRDKTFFDLRIDFEVDFRLVFADRDDFGDGEVLEPSEIDF